MLPHSHKHQELMLALMEERSVGEVKWDRSVPDTVPLLRLDKVTVYFSSKPVASLGISNLETKTYTGLFSMKITTSAT